MSSVDQSHQSQSQSQSQYQYQYSPKINTGAFPLKSPPPPNHVNSLSNNNSVMNKTMSTPPIRYSKAIEKSDYVTTQFQNLSLGSRNLPYAGKMSSICLFFDQVINLNNSETILQKSKDFQFYKTLQQEYDLKPHAREAGKVNDELFTSIGPHLAIPFDLWLRDEICIKDIKVKITMLKEINGMVDAELKDVTNQSSFEVTLNYYGKLLTAYNFYEVPMRNSAYKQLTGSASASRNGNGSGNGNSGSFHDQIDEELEFNRDRMSNSSPDFDFGYLEKPFYRSHSNQSNDSQSNAHHNKRTSTSSISSKKRFSSFLTGGSGSNHRDGSNVSSSSPDLRDGSHRRSQFSTPTTPPQPQFKQFLTSTPPSSSHHYLQQQDGSPTPKSHLYEDSNGTPTSSNNNSMSVNSILSKSRLYNRMKRNRESGSSVNTNTSHQSYPSNRSSVATTASGGGGGAVTSSGGSRRRSSVTNVKHLFGGGNNSGSGSGNGNGNGSGSGDVSSFDSSRTLMPVDSYPQSTENIVLTKEEKLENCKDKHEYYIQVDQLVKESRRILHILFNSSDSSIKENTKLGKLVDFVTTKVFKFVLIDLVSMILTYCDLKCCNYKLI
ncbi:hypothetical protein CORT_0G03180 [Candida orthopsilosis Co 90-125]|uniref:Uncharacterized protein n=1 Tax=Candida orthopsilosis (strain 90-125) TaxID=1136231 RepID=H8XA18_CANO9|nr:hypothetical protein CORT_0G03180 [Candida orthopsilosis Co 90-125]CCG24995.1 hypothetical protein CORT_0G03180 [Candida orthopsilosis Co 90-125]